MSSDLEHATAVARWMREQGVSRVRLSPNSGEITEIELSPAPPEFPDDPASPGDADVLDPTLCPLCQREKPAGGLWGGLCRTCGRKGAGLDAPAGLSG